MTRGLAGLSAAGATILAPVIAASGVADQNRGRVMGIVFAGAGPEVMGLSFSLPRFLGDGPWGGWLFTAGLVLVCILLAWPGRKAAAASQSHAVTVQFGGKVRLRLWILAIAYALVAVGIVPHSIYLPVCVHQKPGMPLSFSTMVFGVHGLGVLPGGPVLDGQLTWRLGTWLALLASTLVGLVAVVLATDHVAWVVASGGLPGMSQMGVASITAHRVIELAGPAGHTRWWSRMTVGFNIGQAGGALPMGPMLHAGWGYRAGFAMAAVSLCVSPVLALLVRSPRGAATPGHSPLPDRPLPH